jgi:hypothetical protein
MIKRSAISLGAITKEIGERKTTTTLTGLLKTKDIITIQD